MSEPALSTRYSAAKVESKWYQAWEEAGAFQPDTDESKPVYSITIPPPNITGSLHMGHALCYSLQDLLGRFKRMTGHRVLILPGQDHAGIATQTVVSKQLKKEGVNSVEVGREKFVERVWEWRKESGDTILNQFRALGCSFDWSHQRFTLDEKYAEAVLKVFIDWFDRGLIYKGLRVVNWDPTLKTSVSDIETERELINGKLYHIRYPFADGSGYVVVATTRPETMLADVAVAVHPSDERYKGLVGKELNLPLTDRQIPLIADEHPDPEFGTGAVKITPGHDANDFEVGQRHGLEVLLMLDESARVTELGGKYAGMSREQARKQVVADLEELDLLEKIEDHQIAILKSDRSKDIIEPMASHQWFVNQRELAKPAIDVVKSGQIKFAPERFKDIYLDWLENIRDWCVSRQLWWGHRIPVFYTEDDQAVAALSWEEAEQKAGKKIVRQEEDVLDTWFSSGLWPFATLGWPEQTDDLKTFYPTSVLVTARDILYLWVARMVMMGLDFTKEIPFHQVYIYATVLTEDGKRMSKSLGTGVDPMEIINTVGADALRYTLQSQTGLNQDLRYSDRRTEEARNFCNKIWNASRFIMMNLDGYEGNEPNGVEPEDKWILSRLASTERLVSESFETYDIQTATQALHKFFWSELCDWYIEISKARLTDEAHRQTPQWVLVTCLTSFLKMMHPIMPHITEEIYSHLPIEGKARFLCDESWPSLPEQWVDKAAEERVEGWLEAVRTFRALRHELSIPPMQTLEVAYIEGDLQGGEDVFLSQAKVERLESGRPDGEPFISGTSGGVDLHLPTAGLVDREKEVARLTAEKEKLEKELIGLDKRLGNPQFVERAKPEIVERDRAAAEELREHIAKVEDRIRLFS